MNPRVFLCELVDPASGKGLLPIETFVITKEEMGPHTGHHEEHYLAMAMSKAMESGIQHGLKLGKFNVDCIDATY